MPSAVLLVSRTTVTLWTREVSGLLRISERRLAAFAGLAVLATFLFGIVLALVGSSQIDSALPGELRTTILRTAFGSALLSTAIVTTVLCLTAPPRTALSTLLDLLPVSRWSARIGQVVPPLAVGFVFSLALSATSIAVLAALLGVGAALVGSLVVLVLSVLIVQCVVVGSFQLLSGALRRYLRLPQHYGSGVAAAILIGLAAWAVLGDVLTLALDDAAAVEARDLLIHRALAAVVVSPGDALGWAVLVAWLVAAALLLGASGPSLPQDGGAGSIALLRGTSPRPGRFLASTWLELLTAVRTPQTIVGVISVIPLIAIVHRLLDIELVSESASLLAQGIPIVPYLLAVFAIGRALPHRWVGMQLTADGDRWMLPVVSAYLLIGAVVSTPVVVAELLLGMIDGADIAGIVARSLLAFAAALLGGALVPYGDEQPLSVTVSGFITALIYVGSTLSISLLGPSLPDGVPTALLAAVAILLLLMARAIVLRQDDHVRRA